jgi:signal transduction histidine kinase/CheY-like chemotaxis protein
VEILPVQLITGHPSAALLALAGLIGIVVVTSVITLKVGVRRKTAEIDRRLAEQIELREAAEKANKAKADFLANMSHEIRTPMNAIAGFTDLALKSNLSPDLRDYLDTVRNSADWLMHIVHDVLEFSRIEAGSLQLDNERFNFADCIRSAIKMVQPEASAKNLPVRLKLDPQIPPVVSGDPIRLRHVVLNLIDNAVKFTTVGSVMVTVSLESKTADSVLVRVSVADTGIGIPPNKHKLIFEPFRGSDELQLGGFTANGLGLAISKQLVNLMGGNMEFQSQLGAGSTFQFTAWFQKIERSIDKEDAQPKTGEHAPQRLSILVAEDNAVNRRLITKVLESAHHRVTCVSDGQQAVQRASMEVFDLILMDVEMPHMDGLEATRKIRAAEMRGFHVPIYALTAHTFPTDREQCFQAGMDGFISKPIQMDEVLRIVSGVVTRTPVEDLAMQ